MKDMTLEDLAKATDVAAVVAERMRTSKTTQDGNGRGVTQERDCSAGTGQPEECSSGSRIRIRTEGGDNVHQEDGGGGGGGTRTHAPPEGRSRVLGGGRGINQRENCRRGAGSRRGTTQQDDDECSVYFRSESICEGQRLPSPSRRTSTASSGGLSGGKGKRTIYLGRTQAFPLRRVESSLAVDDRGFGVSGVSPDIAAGKMTLIYNTAVFKRDDTIYFFARPIILPLTHYTSGSPFIPYIS